MEAQDCPTGWQVALVLTLGTLAVSTAAILVRLATADAAASNVGFSLVLAASRLTLAAIVLLPNWWRLGRRSLTKTSFKYAGLAGLALAIHFATWITSLSYTSIAASTTLVTTNPVWVSLIAWFWLREKPTRLALTGISISLIGSSLISLAANTIHATANPLLGNSLALIGAWAASFYFLLGRKAQQHGLSIGGYVTVAYSIAAIALLPLPMLFGASYTGYSSITYFYIGLMAVLPQLIGHTSLNWAIQWISPTLVTLVILLEPVLSSALGYLILAEVPGSMVLIGALVIMVGVWIAAVGMR